MNIKACPFNREIYLGRAAIGVEADPFPVPDGAIAPTFGGLRGFSHIKLCFWEYVDGLFNRVAPTYVAGGYITTAWRMYDGVKQYLYGTMTHDHFTSNIGALVSTGYNIIEPSNNLAILDCPGTVEGVLFRANNGMNKWVEAWGYRSMHDNNWHNTRANHSGG